MRLLALALVVLGCRAPIPVAPIEATAQVGPTRFVFRASVLANLTFQLDCLAEVITCSREAHRTAWQSGWSAEDEAALATWKALRIRLDAPGATGPRTPLPLPFQASSLATAVRIAGLEATELGDYVRRLPSQVGSEDSEALRGVIARFLPRAAQRWQRVRPRLEAAARSYTALLARAEIAALLDKIAGFYRTDRSAVQIFELIARPADRSSTFAEMLGPLAVVEVMDGDPPARQLPVVLHELFHRWFATSPLATQVELANRFAGAGDPLAGPGWGLLDEVLATTFGNGLVQGAIDRPALARLLATPGGMYADPLIDAGAKAMLPQAERWLTTRSIADPAFVGDYLAVLRAAFPAGMPAAAYLRPLACWGSAANALAHLQEVSGASHVECSSDPADLAELATLTAWGTVVLLTTAELATRAPDALIDQATLAELRAATPPVIHAASRTPVGTRFVLVAADEAQLRTLIDALVAAPALHPGSWTPVR